MYDAARSIALEALRAAAYGPLITIEDPVELHSHHPHVVRAETRAPNVLGRAAVTQRDLLRNALRMRPDRIIIGEVRSGEAFDMLQAMNTGHEGSLTSVHANSPRNALSRVQNMVVMAGLDLPAQAIREQLASALHVVVQIARMRVGSRRVKQIPEVTGIESTTVSVQDVFALESRQVEGESQPQLEPTGLIPQWRERRGWAWLRRWTRPCEAGASWPAARRDRAPARRHQARPVATRGTAADGRSTGHP